MIIIFLFFKNEFDYYLRIKVVADKLIGF